VRVRLEENFRRVCEMLREMEALAEPKERLAVAAELRQHIALAEKALELAARAQAVREFEETVLDVLASADPALRRRVVDELNARAAAAGLLCSGDDTVLGGAVA
jgi:hypothetical protein